MFKPLLFYFFAWRTFLFIILFFAIPTLILQFNFLGGGISNYLAQPYMWAWSNFDGEQYLLIAREGYQGFSYFYFPLYPLIIRQIAVFTQGYLYDYLVSGLMVSNTAFLAGLVGFARLVKLDFNDRVVKTSLVLLLLFPTSFYFGSVYTESLFFALSVWSIYSARQGRWLVAGLLGFLASATRISGLALLPALLIEFLIQKKKSSKSFSRDDIKKFGSILLSVGGIALYMIFLAKKTGEPLAFFYNLNSVFGEQRSEGLVFLPQVFYRYIARILPNLNYGYFPGVFTAWLEFLCAVIFGALTVIGLLGSFNKFKLHKIRGSYVVFMIVAYVLFTLSGSFSSLPRYVLVIFPAFIIMAFYIERLGAVAKNLLYCFLFACMLISASLFVRGYWIS